MPNHVRNTVVIEGPKSDVDALIAKVKGDDKDFDFDKIIRMPPELMEVHSGGVTIDGKSHTLWFEKEDGKPEPIPESTLAEWRKKFGADNWYGWSIKNWGVKWNAYDVMMQLYGAGCVEYIFNSAWDSPRPVFDALSLLFPRIKISVFCDGEVDEPFHYSVGPKIKTGGLRR